MKSQLTPLLLLSACFVLVSGAAGERFRCGPAALARWFIHGRALNCYYRCALSIRNYGLEEDGTPCIIKYNNHGVCHQGYCVKYPPAKPAPPVTEKPNSGVSGTTEVVTRAPEVSTTRAQTPDAIKPEEQFTSTRTPDIPQRSKHASTQTETVTVTRPYTTTGLPESETTSTKHFTSTRVPEWSKYPGFQFTTQETTTSNTYEGDAIRTYHDDDNSNKQARTTRYEARPTDQELQTTTVEERTTTKKYDEEENAEFVF